VWSAKLRLSSNEALAFVVLQSNGLPCSAQRSTRMFDLSHTSADCTLVSSALARINWAASAGYQRSTKAVIDIPLGVYDQGRAEGSEALLPLKVRD
jgi:hypothetical protein